MKGQIKDQVQVLVSADGKDYQSAGRFNFDLRWKVALGIEVPTPFKRLTFREALDRYGIDKPDTRFGMELVDFTEEFRASSFKVFSGTIANGGVVKAINAKGLACATQGQLETMTELAKSFGAKGLAYIKVEGGEWKSPIVKFLSDAEKAALTSKLKIEEGDLILFAADQWLNACEILGKIRLYCADVLKASGKLAIPADRFDFLWVVDFPLFEHSEEQQAFVAAHPPFTSPRPEDVPSLLSDPGRVKARAYDVVTSLLMLTVTWFFVGNVLARTLLAGLAGAGLARFALWRRLRRA